eukprot:SAG22_NODE_307_length_12666_cov_761.250259_11_plen_169_part_00
MQAGAGAFRVGPSRSVLHNTRDRIDHEQEETLPLSRQSFVLWVVVILERERERVCVCARARVCVLRLGESRMHYSPHGRRFIPSSLSGIFLSSNESQCSEAKRVFSWPWFSTSVSVPQTGPISKYSTLVRSFTMLSSSLLVSNAIFWISFSDWPECAMHGTIEARISA